MRTQKAAAAVVITGSGLMFWVILSLCGVLSTVSYGQVANRIRTAKTLSWTETISPGGGVPDVRLKLLFKEPGHVRLEGPGSAVTVIDSAAGKMLLLIPESKIAQLAKIESGATPPPELDMVADFKKLATGKAKPISDRQIGNTKAKGFEVSEGGRTVRVWADPKTGLPLAAEMPVAVAGQEAPVSLSDLQFDQPLDDGLFDLTPPAGYTQAAAELTLPAPADVEPTVVDLLRLYAKKSKGQFPPRLDDMNAFIQLASGGSKDGTLDADSQRMMSDVGSLIAQLSAREKGKDYDYTPGDARLGDASKVVFWLRDKDANHYRAVYGDLSAKPATESQIFHKP